MNSRNSSSVYRVNFEKSVVKNVFAKSLKNHCSGTGGPTTGTSGTQGLPLKRYPPGGRRARKNFGNRYFWAQKKFFWWRHSWKTGSAIHFRSTAYAAEGHGARLVEISGPCHVGVSVETSIESLIFRLVMSIGQNEEEAESILGLELLNTFSMRSRGGE